MIVDGEPALAEGVTDAVTASMGPSMIVDGEGLDGAHAARVVLASMGPSMIVDGEVSKFTVLVEMSVLQWGRR